jgi:lysophospholipase L1-like esterase
VGSKHLILLAAVSLAWSCAACSSSSKTGVGTTEPASASTTTSTAELSPELRAAVESIHVVTAVGDSVPYGTACECTPYPGLVGADIQHVAGHNVEVLNNAVPGYTSKNVVDQLHHDTPTIDDLRGSQVVMVEVGANDVAHSSTCGTTVACYDAKIPDIERNLATIVQRIHDLRSGHDVEVVLLDYWSVWLGGQYAEAQGNEYVNAADAVTDHVSSAIQSVAHSTDSIYIDLRAAFRGPDHAWDETHLLAPDGDHPNARGHQRIAEAIAHTVAIQ